MEQLFSSDLKRSQFKAIGLVILVVSVLWLYYPNGAHKIVIVLSFALVIGNMYAKWQVQDLDETNKQLMLKLNSLQDIVNKFALEKSKTMQSKNVRFTELDALYTNAGLINFLYSIRYLYDYNKPLFYLVTVGTNNILKIAMQIEAYYNANGEYPENTSEMFEDALLIRSKVINQIHNFVYTIPKTGVFFETQIKVIDRYMVLVTRITDTLHKYYKANIARRGISRRTFFVEYDGTKPFDSERNWATVPEKNKRTVILDHYI